MSRTRPARPAATFAPPKRTPSSGDYLRAAWQRLRRDATAMVALALLAAICLAALAAPLITAHVLRQDPNRGRLVERFRPPSREHYLGTDEFGRDTLARLLHAGRVSLTVGFLVAAISLTIGASLGLVAGYYGGRIDDAINALIQLVVNIPGFFLLLLLSVLFRPSILGLALIFGLLGWPIVARQVRGRVLSERRREYVEAAVVAGAHPVRVLFGHLLPNVGSLVLVLAGFEVGGAIIAEAGLSALGFGVQIPTPSWGNMLSRSLDHFDRAWWLVAAPGAAIVLTVFSIFLLADGLRDALDPRLSKGSVDGR